MTITGDFFDRIHDKAVFIDEIHGDFYERGVEMGVYIHWNSARIQDAYFQWLQDLERVEMVEDKVRKADHLKCAAHLIYWLRRSSPVNDMAYEGEMTEGIEFMLKYGREYLAFDLGYRAAQVVECNIYGRSLPPASFSLQSNLPGAVRNDFIETTCHALKLKNVSPHAILLTIKAIFLRP